MKRVLISVFAVWLSISVFATEKEVQVKIYTTMGNITVKLYNETPQHRDNFIKLVEEHKYDSIMFHRVIKLFMIQAGEKYPPLEDEMAALNNPIVQAKDTVKLKKWQIGKKINRALTKKEKPKKLMPRDPNYKEPDYTIPAEIVYPQYFHKRGQLCAARTGDDVNPEKKSSALQFYIVTGKHFTDHELDKIEQSKNIKFTPEQREAYKFQGGAQHLDGDYTIFGEVVKGLKVVQKIELSPVGYNNRPLKDIRIKKTKILNK